MDVEQGSGPGSPYYWPQHPADADFHEGEWFLGWQGTGWTVAAVPPGGFPFVDPPFPVADFGPPGTVWIFTLADLVLSFADLPTQPTLFAINTALKKLGANVGAGAIQGWRTPNPEALPQPERRPMQFVRTQVVQAVGTIEQAVHVFHWAPIGADAGNLDTPALKAHGDAVRDSWQTFLDTPVRGNTGGGGSNGAWRRFMAPLARYTEVRTSLVNQAGPGDWVSYGPGAEQTQHEGADQNQIGQTAISPFAAGQGNAIPGAGAALPYEVALCVGLNTNFRGPRFRGRCYLGPLSVAPMGDDGLFQANSSLDVAHNLGEFLDRVNANGNLKASVISGKFATWAPIQGTRAGVVPDSQRRRRRGQVENYVQAWGTAIGGAA